MAENMTEKFLQSLPAEIIGGKAGCLALLDDLTEIIYLSDVMDYHLIYINKRGREVFDLPENYSGRKCYEVFQGRDTPCHFCTNPSLGSSGFYNWEHTNPHTGRHYYLRDKLVMTQGRLARLEIAFDVTEEKEQNQALKNLISINNVVMRCVKLLHSTNDFSKSVQDVLHIIGSFLQADRAYIFEFHNGSMSNTGEWCAPGVLSEIHHLQDMDLSDIAGWLKVFQQRECVVIENLEDIRQTDPDIYAILRPQKISRLIVVPLELDGKLMGCIGLDNPPADKLKNIASPLLTLSSFITASMQREATRRRLEHMSYTDHLTGVLNRNAFIRDTDISALYHWDSVGILFLDVDRLKEANDRHGHLYGDQMLKRMAEILTSVFPPEQVYRVGGDEFVVLWPSSGQEEFAQKALELEERLGRRDGCPASVGVRWSQKCADIQKLINEADQNMYRKKCMAYKRPEKSRHPR